LGDFAISKTCSKISFRKNPRTSSTREFPDEVLDVLGFFLKLIFEHVFDIAKGTGHSKIAIL
jgi:hypothetical protein